MQYLPQETQEKIKDLKRKLQRIQVTPIPGSLAIKRNGDHPEYYHQTVDERKIHRKYISLEQYGPGKTVGPTGLQSVHVCSPLLDGEGEHEPSGDRPGCGSAAP